MVKAGLIESTSGVNGGYILCENADEISFMDVIYAIEGNGALFKCGFEENKCLINKVMAEGEALLEKYLQDKKLYEVARK